MGNLNVCLLHTTLLLYILQVMETYGTAMHAMFIKCRTTNTEYKPWLSFFLFLRYLWSDVSRLRVFLPHDHKNIGKAYGKIILFTMKWRMRKIWKGKFIDFCSFSLPLSWCLINTIQYSLLFSICALFAI